MRKIAVSLTCLALAAPLAAVAEESLTASLSLEQGACFDQGSVTATRAVSAEYRRAADALDMHAYARHAPTGLDCTESGLTVDMGLDRRWDARVGGIYGVAQFAADKVSVVGSYSLAGQNQLWRYAVDGTPTYVAAVGFGKAWGPFSAELSANAVPTDWVDGSSQGARLALAYGPELWGGGLLLQASTEAGRRVSGLARWSRAFDDGPLGVTVSYRYEGGLDELAPPFAAMLPGGWALAPAAGETSVLDVGLTWLVE